ncbi:MAG: hypothetical protein R3Y06_07020 [Faecalibacterium sp.]
MRQLPFEITPEMLEGTEVLPIKLISERVVATDAVREISDSSSTAYRDITDEEMDYRFGEITKLAIEEMKLRGTPIARFDSVLRKAYLEYPDGTREYKDG